MNSKTSQKRSKDSHKTSSSVVEKTAKSVEILGITLTSTPRAELLRKIWLQRKEMLHVATVNPEYIMEARVNQKFREVLSKCVCAIDGHGVMWASQITNYKPALPRGRFSN